MAFPVMLRLSIRMIRRMEKLDMGRRPRKGKSKVRSGTLGREIMRQVPDKLISVRYMPGDVHKRQLTSSTAQVP